MAKYIRKLQSSGLFEQTVRSQFENRETSFTEHLKNLN